MNISVQESGHGTFFQLRLVKRFRLKRFPGAPPNTWMWENKMDHRDTTTVCGGVNCIVLKYERLPFREMCLPLRRLS